MPKNAPIKRAPFTVSISIALRDRLRTLSKSLGVKTSSLIDEAVMGLLAKYAEKGGIQLMNDGEERKTQHVICVASGKGGVGKTTTTESLAYLFSTLGEKKVLLIDADAQINLTETMKVDVDGKRDIRGAIMTRANSIDVPLETFILPTQYKNIDIIAGNPYIEKDEFISIIRKAKLEENMNPWIEVMNEIRAMGQYDIVLMDTHPSYGMETSYPLQACDWVLIPLEPDSRSVSGCTEVYKEIVKTRKRVNPNIKLLGIFFNKVKHNTNSSKQYIPSAHENLPEIFAQLNGGESEGKFFETTIRDSEDVRKAVIFHSAVTERFRSNKVGKDFEKLYYEIVKELFGNE